jgi:hypothetical protein
MDTGARMEPLSRLRDLRRRIGSGDETPPLAALFSGIYSEVAIPLDSGRLIPIAKRCG